MVLAHHLEHSILDLRIVDEAPHALCFPMVAHSTLIDGQEEHFAVCTVGEIFCFGTHRLDSVHKILAAHHSILDKAVKSGSPLWPSTSLRNFGIVHLHLIPALCNRFIVGAFPQL